MEKIKLAVIIDQKISSGGGYQQSINAAMIAKKIPSNLADVIFYTTVKENIKTLKDFNIEANFINFSFLSKVRTYFYRIIKERKIISFFRLFERNNPREKIFIKDNVDLVYFLSPTSWPIDLEKTNYITTIWDLSHRDDPEFPEVRWGREFERRENNYRSILPAATAVLVDSKLSKENITNRYGVDNDRVFEMPFQASIFTRKESNFRDNDIDIKKKYELNVPYVFYPAQFWSHKNHIYILEGLKDLEVNFGLKVGAIFCGEDKGNLSHIKDCAYKLKLLERIRFIGFVPNSEMPYLYKQSIALVMPTYFGPTNLPPIEAFELGTPVLYSDLKGMRDQVEDAALMLDLSDSKTLANHLKDLIENDQIAKKLIQKGKEKIRDLNAFDHLNVLKIIIKKFIFKRKTWK